MAEETKKKTVDNKDIRVAVNRVGKNGCLLIHARTGDAPSDFAVDNFGHWRNYCSAMSKDEELAVFEDIAGGTYEAEMGRGTGAIAVKLRSGRSIKLSWYAPSLIMGHMLADGLFVRENREDGTFSIELIEDCGHTRWALDHYPRVVTEDQMLSVLRAIRMREYTAKRVSEQTTDLEVCGLHFIMWRDRRPAFFVDQQPVPAQQQPPQAVVHVGINCIQHLLGGKPNSCFIIHAWTKEDEIAEDGFGLYRRVIYPKTCDALSHMEDVAGEMFTAKLTEGQRVELVMRDCTYDLLWSAQSMQAYLDRDGMRVRHNREDGSLSLSLVENGGLDNFACEFFMPPRDKVLSIVHDLRAGLYILQRSDHNNIVIVNVCGCGAVLERVAATVNDAAPAKEEARCRPGQIPGNLVGVTRMPASPLDDELGGLPKPVHVQSANIEEVVNGQNVRVGYRVVVWENNAARDVYASDPVVEYPDKWVRDIIDGQYTVWRISKPGCEETLRVDFFDFALHGCATLRKQVAPVGKGNDKEKGAGPGIAPAAKNQEEEKYSYSAEICDGFLRVTRNNPLDPKDVVVYCITNWRVSELWIKCISSNNYTVAPLGDNAVQVGSDAGCLGVHKCEQHTSAAVAAAARDAIAKATKQPGNRVAVHSMVVVTVPNGGAMCHYIKMVEQNEARDVYRTAQCANFPSKWADAVRANQWSVFRTEDPDKLRINFAPEGMAEDDVFVWKVRSTTPEKRAIPEEEKKPAVAAAEGEKEECPFLAEAKSGGKALGIWGGAVKGEGDAKFIEFYVGDDVYRTDQYIPQHWTEAVNAGQWEVYRNPQMAQMLRVIIKNQDVVAAWKVPKDEKKPPMEQAKEKKISPAAEELDLHIKTQRAINAESYERQEAMGKDIVELRTEMRSLVEKLRSDVESMRAMFSSLHAHTNVLLADAPMVCAIGPGAVWYSCEKLCQKTRVDISAYGFKKAPFVAIDDGGMEAREESEVSVSAGATKDYVEIVVRGRVDDVGMLERIKYLMIRQ